jgi:hypothetical protein
MTKEEKLISMLQPKEYISKIKLYCNYCTHHNLIVNLEDENTENKGSV